jgi:hypothetical protein
VAGRETTREAAAGVLKEVRVVGNGDAGDC